MYVTLPTHVPRQTVHRADSKKKESSHVWSFICLAPESVENSMTQRKSWGKEIKKKIILHSTTVEIKILFNFFCSKIMQNRLFLSLIFWYCFIFDVFVSSRSIKSVRAYQGTCGNFILKRLSQKHVYNRCATIEDRVQRVLVNRRMLINIDAATKPF